MRRKSYNILLAKRAQVLTMLGIIFVLIGYGYFRDTLPPTGAHQLTLATEIASIKFWGVCWGVCGLTAIVTGWWPPFKDTWGFTALSVMSIWWCMMYGAGMVVFHVSGSYRGFLSWLIVSILAEVISGWPDPPSRNRVVISIETTIEGEDEDGRRS